jgi:hypothetical protein
VFGDRRGVEIMDDQIKTIAEALADPQSVAMPVLVEHVPDDSGGLKAIVRTPISYEVVADDV